MSKSKLALGLLALSAIVAGGTALAQTAAPAPDAATAAPAAGAELQEVTVSASAITIAGYDQPTPVTSLGLAQLQSAAQPDLGDSLRNLPAFAGSSSPQNSVESNNISNGNAGEDQISMRDLGPKRTLVLIDGQRVVDGVQAGGAELSNIPTTLVQRVDVVTGGASAIWGSSAVAGVVNYILNKNFNGVMVNLEASNNSQSDHPEYNGDLTVGTGFDDDRGHIEASVSEMRLPSTFYVSQDQGFDYQRLVNNPACNLTSGTPSPLTGAICPQGQPWLLHANNVGISSATPGGLIYGCQNAAGVKIAGCALANTYFVGPNATPQTFNPGNVSASFFSNGGSASTLVGDGEIQGIPQKTDTAFALGTFKINDHVRATAQFDYGNTGFYENSYDDIQYGTTNPATIYSGNPYIPASIQSAMNTNGIGSLQVGTTNTNPFTGQTSNVQQQYDSVGMITLYESRRLLRGVVGLDGDIGDNWTWNAYYERSETHQYEAGLNNDLTSALVNAENAVTVGTYTPTYTATAYPNPLGFKTGTITCASNLLPVGAAGATSNCAPLNIFGSGAGVASEAAINYINGVTRDGGNTTHTDLFQNVVAGTVQGKLPVGTPAGPMALAVGGVYRNESGQQTNCGVNCTDVNFPFGNFGGLNGSYHVEEGSVELNAPLLKDQGVKDLSVDLAWRGIDYSTSGFVQTYKLGMLSQINDMVRLRASYSVDIRACDMAECFQTPQSVGASTHDPRTGQTVAYYSVSEGNPNLQPESAETRTAGFVFTPVQGLTASIDWWYIRIKDVITTGLSVAQTEAGCVQGVAADCEQLVFGSNPVSGCRGPTIDTCPAGEPLVGVYRPDVNAPVYTTDGVDFLADYRMPFMAGALDFNFDSDYTFMLRYVSSKGTCDPMNSVGGDEGTYCGVGGNVKFRGTFATSYTQGPWIGSIQARMLGQQELVNWWQSGVEVDNNNIPFYTYVDLRLSYKFDNGIQLYGAVDNVGDRLLPVVPFSAYSGGTLYEPPFNTSLYDPYGRVWRLGVRAKF